MKKYFLQFINILIYIFSFLFLLSVFFKMTSYLVASNEKYVVIIIWIMGTIFATRFTRPLYQEILAWRLPLREWLRLHHLKQ